MSSIPIALTIAGSDSSGGAGIQADLKTFSAFGVYGASVITALTAQNTQGVQGVEAIPAVFVSRQLDSVLSDLDVAAVKTGMLANREVVEAVAAGLARLRHRPLVVDPVMVATSGDVLLAPEAVSAVRTRLVPLAGVLTPNLPEAAHLLGTGPARNEAEMLVQARALADQGAAAVLIKGGHGEGGEAVDMLWDGTDVHRYALPRVDTRHTHGTGCTLAAAIAALLALGVPLPAAVGRAKDYVWHGLEAGRTLGIGGGRGPVDHLYAVRRNPPPA